MMGRIANKTPEVGYGGKDTGIQPRSIGSRLPLERTGNAPVDKHLDRLSYYLDDLIRVPGTNLRFGLDPIISFLFPVAGDTIASLMSAYIVLVSIRYGLPKSVITRMVFNIGADYAIGSIPFVGDIFDFAWKANDKNMKLLNKHAQGEGKSTLGDWVWVLVLLAALMAFIAVIIGVVIYAISSTGVGLF
jgi:hypothetical protein